GIVAVPRRADEARSGHWPGRDGAGRGMRGGRLPEQPDRAAGHEDEGERGRDELARGEGEAARRRRDARGQLDHAWRGGRGDACRDGRPEVALGRPVVERGGPGEDALEVCERGGAVRTGAEVRLERGALGGRELVVQVLGKPIGPRVVHDANLSGRDARAAPCARGATGTWTFRC